MKFIGISAFGLDDALCVDTSLVPGPYDLPASVLLPDLPRAPIKAGLDAAESRVFSGMQWPEDARVAGDDIRRVPVAAAWKRLAESRGYSPRWQRKSVSFPISDILAAHVRSLLVDNGCQPQSGDRCCLVIPNHLDMFAQEALLRSLRHVGFDGEGTSLLWRPVAAALSWLSALKHQSVRALLDNLHAQLLLVYAGVDAIEITFLGLEPREKGGKTYILPVRSNPEPALKLCGLDWALEMAEACDALCQTDEGALWQAAFRFPQVWQLLTNKPLDTEPIPWSTREGWRLWQPRSSFDPLQLQACRHAWTSILARTKDEDEDADPQSLPGETSWQDWLRKSLEDGLKSAKCDIAGGVLFGPLASLLAPLLADLPALHGRVSDVPRMHFVWHAVEDCMAQGAVLYASRLAANLPTYLDTLPRLEVYGTKNGRRAWMDLVPTSTVEGGKFHKDSIHNTFYVPADNPVLQMYLRLGGESENGEDNIRTADFKFPETPTQNEPLRLDVRMRPASGLAQVDLVPENRSFLGGRKIPFDFERMKPGSLSEIAGSAKSGQSYPENITRTVLVPSQEWMYQPMVQNLLRYGPDDCRNRKVANDIMFGLYEFRDVPKQVNDRETYPPRVDQDGMTDCPEGDALVQQIARQAEMFWHSFCRYQPNLLRMYITRATWLWKATPQCIIDGIYDILADHYLDRPHYKYMRLDDRNLGYVYEAAGRCFSQEEHCRMMFNIFEQRNQNKIYIGFIRPLYRLLSYTPVAKDYLDDRFAYFLIYLSIKTARQELRYRYLTRTFFVGIQLFLVALMRRKGNPDFMNKNTNEMAARYYDEMTQLLEYAQTRDSWDGVSRILEGIKKYMDYEGEAGLLGIIDQEASGSGRSSGYGSRGYRS